MGAQDIAYYINELMFLSFFFSFTSLTLVCTQPVDQHDRFGLTLSCEETVSDKGRKKESNGKTVKKQHKEVTEDL